MLANFSVNSEKSRACMHRETETFVQLQAASEPSPDADGKRPARGQTNGAQHVIARSIGAEGNFSLTNFIASGYRFRLAS
jgi:hypothetical protein